MDQIAESPPRPTPKKISRRNMFKLGAAATGVELLKKYGLDIMQNEEGSLSQRSTIFSSLINNLDLAKKINDQSRIETAEKTIYLWTLCNAMELGAKAKGLNTAASNMRHFLYGQGQAVNLSATLKDYLIGEYNHPYNQDGLPAGINSVIASAIETDLRTNAAQKPTAAGISEKIENVHRLSTESLRKPLICAARPLFNDVKHNEDWYYGVGSSMYKLSFDLSDKPYATGTAYNNMPYVFLGLDSYNLEMTDVYDWDHELFIPNEVFVEEFLKLVKVDPKNNPLTTPLQGLLTSIGKKFYPGGAREQDIDLLVQQNLAKKFPMSASLEDKNLNISAAIPTIG